MQYLALIYGDQSVWESLSPEQREDAYKQYGAFATEARGRRDGRRRRARLDLDRDDGPRARGRDGRDGRSVCRS